MRQGRDRGTAWSGSSEFLPAVTCLPGHLRESPMGIKASVPLSHLNIPLTEGAFPALTSERCPFSATIFVGFPFDISILGLLGPHACSPSSPRNPSNTSPPSTSSWSKCMWPPPFLTSETLKTSPPATTRTHSTILSLLGKPLEGPAFYPWAKSLLIRAAAK